MLAVSMGVGLDSGSLVPPVAAPSMHILTEGSDAVLTENSDNVTQE